MTGEARTSRRVFWDATCAALAIGTLGGRPVLAVGQNSVDARTGLIRLCDLSAGIPEPVPVVAHEDGRVTALSICSGALLSAGLDRVATDIRLPSGEIFRQVSGQPAVRRWAPAARGGLRPAGTVARPEEEITVLAEAPGAGPPMIACGDGRAVRLLHAETGALVRETPFGPCERVRTVAAASLPDGTPVVIAGAGSTIRAWDVEHGSELYPPFVPDQDAPDVTGLAVARSGSGLLAAAAGGWRSGVLVWDLATGQAGARRLTGPTYVEAMTARDVGGRAVAVLAANRDIWGFDLETGADMFRLRLADDAQASAVELFEDGGRAVLVAGSAGRASITAWDIDASGGVPAAGAVTTVPDELKSLGLARVDGQPVAICVGGEGNIQLIALPGGHGDADPGSPVLDVAITTAGTRPAGSLLAAGRDPGS